MSWVLLPLVLPGGRLLLLAHLALIYLASIVIQGVLAGFFVVAFRSRRRLDSFILGGFSAFSLWSKSSQRQGGDETVSHQKMSMMKQRGVTECNP